jgi:hypothetical protein
MKAKNDFNLDDFGTCSSTRKVSQRESPGSKDVPEKRGRELPQVAICLPGVNVSVPRQISLANSSQFCE